MSSYIKTRETALRHINNGANFRNKAYQNFWNDKEVFLAAAKRRFSAHMSDGISLEPWGKTTDDIHKFTKWYEEWCWDPDYVTQIALAQIDKVSKSFLDIDWLAAYLPESFTGSVEILRKVKAWSFVSEGYFTYLSGDARLAQTQDYENTRNRLSPVERFNRGLYESNSELLRKAPFITAQLVRSNLSYLPNLLLNDRDYCFHLARNFECWQGVIFDRYRGDRDFVTDLYEAGIDAKIRFLSYEIRKLVKKADPRTFLSAYRIREQLNASMSTQKPHRKTTPFKI